jgi:hypothetical protein
MDDRLIVRILVSLDGDEWHSEHIVRVPPDYRRQDIEPFVLHETDKAMSEFQSENFGYSRSERIIQQYDRRLVIIAAMLRRLPHGVRRQGFIQRIRDVIDMDGNELRARFGERSLED